MDQLNHLLFIAGILLCGSIFASRISSFMGLPVLLIFLALGMVCGSEGIFLHIDFNDYNLAFLIANVALAIIIFDGGCQTKFYTFKQVIKPSVLLSTIGVLITSLIVSIAAYYVFNLGFFPSLLIGSIIGSTDAGAVFSLLGSNGISLKNKVSNPLQIESATNDPMAIFLTVTVIQLMQGVFSCDNISRSVVEMGLFLAKQFSFGIGFGLIFGFLAKKLMNFVSIPTGLYSLLVLGIAFTGFSITSSLDGSGFLAIFIIGMFIGNQNTRQLNFIRPVQDGLNWLSQIALFLILGLLVNPSNLLDFAIPGLIIAVVLTFIARPIAIFLCLKPFFRFTLKELSFISWVGLRGSVPIVLAIYPIMYRVPHGETYFYVAFVVVIFSLLVQGATILPMAKLLDAYAPSMSAPISKGQIGITIDNDYEIFNYEIKNKNLENVALKDIKFPSKTQIASIFRKGQMFKPSANRKIKKGDIVSIIGHADDELFLNSVFNGDTSLKEPHFYNGDIILNGSLSMPEIAKKYGLVITTLESDLDLSEFMNFHLGGFPQVGDRLTIIDCRLTIFEINGDRIEKVGFEKVDFG